MSKTLILLGAIASIVSAQTPIPPRPDGYVLSGNPSANVVMDVFVDLMCPDSRAIYPTMAELAKHYDADDLQIKYHIFPLPYHHNSYLTAQGLITANLEGGRDSVFQWMDVMYSPNVQEGLGNAATANMTTSQVIAALGDLAENSIDGMKAEDFVSGLSNPSNDWNARVSWKYACSRGVSGTPFWFVNDVQLSASLTYTVDDWASIIDPILAQDKVQDPSHRDMAYTYGEEKGLGLGACAAGTVSCQYLPGVTECCTVGENCIPNVGCRC